jgi:hypothetical protein
MMSHLLAVTALSVDSLAAGWLIGPFVRHRQTARLAVAFGLSDAAATILAQLSGPLKVPLVIAAAYVVACMMCVAVRRRSASIYLVPVLFGLDSLLYPVPIADTALLGVTSAALAYVGLCSGLISFAAYGNQRVWKAAFVLLPALFFLI